MLPFPFFCAGCCVSKNTQMTFDVSKQMLNLRTYYGYCCCFSKDYSINFEDIVGVMVDMQQGCIVGDEPACKVILVLKVSLIALTGYVSETKGNKIKEELMEIMDRCDIMLI